MPLSAAQATHSGSGEEWATLFKLPLSHSTHILTMTFSYAVEEADFDELVIARSHDKPVLLDISAEWCGPCRVLEPLLDKLVKEYNGAFLLAKVDADENM